MTEAMINQFHDLKAKHPDAVLLFRCGDFYEAYDTDAETCAKTLGITLTKQLEMRMTGFPHHALDTYLPKLIRAGHRIAICDQLEDPRLTKKLVKRGISELVSPQEKPAPVKKPKPYKMVLPKLTKKQYDLLCECIRYRCADNDQERAVAVSRGMLTGWYDEMAGELAELKTLIYEQAARDNYK